MSQTSSSRMYVVKRTKPGETEGRREEVQYDKITKRIKGLVNGLHSSIDPAMIAQRVIAGVHSGIKTSELDILAARISHSFTTKHPDYSRLAARLLISNLHKETYNKFSQAIEALYLHQDKKYNEPMPLVTKRVYDIVMNHAELIDSKIMNENDFENYDYFGYKTLEVSYLSRIDGRIIERPQYMLMRVSLGIHGENLERVFETYELMSNKYFTHATPTLFNAGMHNPQMSSCFVAGTPVCTINDGIKKIEEIKIGDTVVSHKGRIKKVEQVHKNLLGDRKLYKINTSKGNVVHVTGNHNLWSITDKSYEDWGIPQWNRVEKLEVGDYIALPNYDGLAEDTIDLAKWIDIIKFPAPKRKYVINVTNNTIEITTVTEKCDHLNGTGNKVIYPKKGNTINRFIKVDSDFAKFLGIWYGDGHIMTTVNQHKDATSRISRGIGITIYNKNKNLIDFCSKIGEKVFGIAPVFHAVKNQNIVQVLFNSAIIGIVFQDIFGKGFHGKKLWTRMYRWNKELVRQLMIGLISSDGHCTKRHEMFLCMSNQSLMNDLWALTHQKGVPTRLHTNKKLKTGATQLLSTLHLPRGYIETKELLKYYEDNRLNKRIDNIKDIRSVKVVDGQTLVKITEKEEITENLPEYVYTLGVEEDHSYNANGLVCENCFLVNVDDSIESIMKGIGDCGKLSKHAGGIGIHFSKVRSKGSRIRGTHGNSKGIVPFLKIYNETANAVDQSGRRPGSFAVYLEPWHADIMAFLELRLNNGNDRERARELFTAVWVNDVFMERVENDGMWSLMCPDECPGLVDAYGESFRELYTKYEKEGKFVSQIKAQDVWRAIMTSQRETGTPYILNKDAANRRNNQKNLGTLKGSNLCAEILIYTSPEETGTCNLASLALAQFVVGDSFDFNKLHNVTQVVTRNLNRVIDINYYPIPEAKNSNLKHRPIAIGVQGLWDTFMKLKLPFTSKEAQELNKKIFETIYHGFLTASCELAKVDGPYSSFKGSPLSQGKFQFDLWNEEASAWNEKYASRKDFEKKYKRDLAETSGLWDWSALRNEIIKFGVRNSLGVALMPTASTSNIMGFMECFECVTSNVYVRRTKAGEFYIVNKYLIEDLMKLDLWTDDMRDRITMAEGSIQGIPEIPTEIRELYKTNWEQSQKEIIRLSVGRTPFVDHTESHNTYIADPQFDKIHTNLMYKWRWGLKTMSYYLRQQVRSAVKFSVDATKLVSTSENVAEESTPTLFCTIDNPDCESCSA